MNFGNEHVILQSLLDPQFEFNNLTYLGYIFADHPSWPKIHDILRHGVKYPLTPINEEERIKRLLFNLNYRNHPVFDEISY